jgi:threonine dehydrogenase-like Zn-dependent dehydrogenase
MADVVRAVVQTAPRRLEMREFPRPVIDADDRVVLRVEACGLCGTDVEQYDGVLGTGSFPMVPGHEPLGIIEEISPATAQLWGVAVGDRVGVESPIPCRFCDKCLAGQYLFCRRRIDSYGGYFPSKRGLGLFGGFAEYMDLHPSSIVHRIDNDVPAQLAAMFVPLAGAVRWTLRYGEVGLGTTLLILGAGQRGLLAVMAARVAGAGTVIMTGLSRDARKLEFAREFGADFTINVEDEDTVARVKEITGGEGIDVVLDLTPVAHQPIRDAIGSVRRGGTVVLAGLKGLTNVEVQTDHLINNGITIKGAFSLDARAYDDAIALIESGKLPLERIQTHQFGLDQVEHAIQLLAGRIPGEDGIHVAILPGL